MKSCGASEKCTLLPSCGGRTRRDFICIQEHRYPGDPPVIQASPVSDVNPIGFYSFITSFSRIGAQWLLTRFTLGLRA